MGLIRDLRAWIDEKFSKLQVIDTERFRIEAKYHYEFDLIVKIVQIFRLIENEKEIYEIRVLD